MLLTSVMSVDRLALAMLSPIATCNYGALVMLNLKQLLCNNYTHCNVLHSVLTIIRVSYPMTTNKVIHVRSLQ